MDGLEVPKLCPQLLTVIPKVVPSFVPSCTQAVRILCRTRRAVNVAAAGEMVRVALAFGRVSEGRYGRGTATCRADW